MDLYMVYIATGDFYEPFELYMVASTLDEALQSAKIKHADLTEDKGMDGYMGQLAFIRKIRSDEALMDFDFRDVPSDMFV